MRLRRRRPSFPILLAATILALASNVLAQPVSRTIVEAGYGEARLTANYPPWRNAYARSTLSTGADEVFQLEAVGRRAFNENGLHLGAAVTRSISPNWYAFVSAGGSTGGFFFPRANGGAMIARKWLGRRQLVTTSAINYYVQKDVHRDVLWTGSVVYYFTQPAAVELGVNVNRGMPGRVVSRSQFVAARVGDPQRRTLTARISAGREAYMRVSTDTALVAFASQVVTVTWRQFVTSDAGFATELERYSNVAYRRTGASVGAFVGTSLLGRSGEKKNGAERP